MDVIFERSGANPFIMNVDFFDTVPEIKEKIHKYQGIPISEQTLIFQDTFLSDDFSVLFSDIVDQSRIQLVVASDANHPAKKMETKNEFPPPPNHPVKMTEYEFPSPETSGASNHPVKMTENELPPPGKLPHQNAQMDVNDTIKQLKQKIHEAKGTDRETLPDSKLRVKSDRSLRVVVLYDGEKTPMEVNKDDRVSKLRKKLEKMKVKVPEEGYFFIHRQDVMEDNKTFRWHQVAQGDEIDIFAGSVSCGS